MIKLSVIIILYNEYELVKKTISSIYENEIDNTEVILIDNSPDNRGYELLLKKFPRIMYFHSKKNLGFGVGVNEGLSKARGEFIIVLTPDMYILKNTIKQTMEYIQSHPEVGLVGGKVYSSPGEQSQSASENYPNLLFLLYYFNVPFYRFIHRVIKNYSPIYFSKEAHRKMLHPKWMGGESMLLRRKAIDEIGGFDPRFFIYFEDVDMCKRLIEKSWQVVYIPVGGVVQNGISKWKKTKITQAIPAYMKSLNLFYLKHYGRVYAVFAWIIVVFSVLLSIFYLAAVGFIKKLLNKPSQAQDLLLLWVGIIKWYSNEGAGIVFLKKYENCGFL